MPPEMISFAASSIDMSSRITSRRGANSRKPVVGFGVEGRKTLSISASPVFCGISPRVSAATKAIAQTPLRGYSTRQACWKAVFDWLNTVSAICFSAL